MESRFINEQYKSLAEQVINEQPELAEVRLYAPRIAYLSSNLEKKNGEDMLVLGQCEKVQNKNKWAINYEYTITLFEPNIEGLSEDQLKILLFHELLHIRIERNKEGGMVYSLNKHDLSDFKIIIDRYGVDWDKRNGGTDAGSGELFTD